MIAANSGTFSSCSSFLIVLSKIMRTSARAKPRPKPKMIPSNRLSSFFGEAGDSEAIAAFTTETLIPVA